MRTFTDFFSKTTESLLFAFYCTTATLILFRPSLQEFALLFVVDTLALWVAGQIDRRVYPKLYPEVNPFFLKLDENIKNYSLAQKVKLFNALLAFPKKRSRYFILANIFKVTPAGLVIVFYFQSADFSLHLSKYLALQVSIIVSHYALTYMEFHDLVSRKIAEYHALYDWTEVFDEVGPTQSDTSFFKHVTVAMSLFACSLLLILLLLIQEGKFNWLFFPLGGVGIVCISWVFHLERRVFVGGMERIFNSLKNVGEVTGRRPVLPFHSVAFLANFEATFNELTKRLRLYEQETSLWVLRQGEKSRFEVIGKMSALVVHDLSGPLHTIQFCADELKESLAQSTHLQSYIEQLELNIQRMSTLIHSIRSSLREPDKDAEIGNIENAHQYCLSLLKGQYPHNDFNKTQFILDPQLKELRPKISQVNLIHVLYNLYKNSLDSLQKAQPAAPLIELRLLRSDVMTVQIVQSDNGCGMLQNEFELLTSYRYLNQQTDKIWVPQRGLGLRLIRRLIEHFDGSLLLMESTRPGAQFMLTLPLEQADHLSYASLVQEQGVEPLELH